MQNPFAIEESEFNAWWEEKLEFNKLYFQVRELFIKNNIPAPVNCLPSCIIPGDSPGKLFKTKLRSIVRSKIYFRNYYVGEWGGLVTEQGESPVLVVNYDLKKRYELLLKKKGIDLYD